MLALEINNLQKTYSNGVQALKGIDFTVEEGDFYALLGANGAGKTTIIGIMTDLVNKTGGTAKVFGIDIDKDFDSAKQLIGVVPQEFNFNIFEKVGDIVCTQAGYYGVPRKIAMKRTEQVLKDLELWDKRNEKSMTLSGGMKRRLLIARALVHQPKLLFLDEPTAGVDVELRHGMWKYLKKLNENGTTVILTTHYLEEVEEMCNNVAIIKEGKIVKEGNVAKMLSSMEQESYILEIEGGCEKQCVKDLSQYSLEYINKDTLEVDLKFEQSITQLINDLSSRKVIVKAIKPKANRMEQIFLNVLQD